MVMMTTTMMMTTTTTTTTTTMVTTTTMKMVMTTTKMMMMTMMTTTVMMTTRTMLMMLIADLLSGPNLHGKALLVAHAGEISLPILNEYGHPCRQKTNTKRIWAPIQTKDKYEDFMGQKGTAHAFTGVEPLTSCFITKQKTFCCEYHSFLSLSLRFLPCAPRCSVGPVTIIPKPNCACFSALSKPRHTCEEES